MNEKLESTLRRSESTILGEIGESAGKGGGVLLLSVLHNNLNDDSGKVDDVVGAQLCKARHVFDHLQKTKTTC